MSEITHRTTTKERRVTDEGVFVVDEIDALEPNFTQSSAQISRNLTVGILLCPEFPLLSLAGLVEALRHAADRGDDSRKLQCDWSVLGVQPGLAVRSSCGIEIRTDAAFPDPGKLDYLAVIGGLLRSLPGVPAPYRAYIHACVRQKIPVIGVCTGIFVLAEEDLLSQQKVCVHDYHLDDLRQRHPSCRPVTGIEFVDNGATLTCPGGTAIIALAAHLVARHCGQDRAIKVVHQMTTARRSGPSLADQMSSIDRPFEPHVATDPRVQRAIVFMERNLLAANVTSLAADHIGVSVRHLERLFQEHAGASPTVYNRRMRLDYARWLLFNTRHSITSIALFAGFNDCSHFVRNFTQRFGIPPGRYRKTAPAQASAAAGTGDREESDTAKSRGAAGVPVSPSA